MKICAAEKLGNFSKPNQVMMAHNMIHRLFHWVLVKII